MIVRSFSNICASCHPLDPLLWRSLLLFGLVECGVSAAVLEMVEQARVHVLQAACVSAPDHQGLAPDHCLDYYLYHLGHPARGADRIPNTHDSGVCVRGHVFPDPLDCYDRSAGEVARTWIRTGQHDLLGVVHDCRAARLCAFVLLPLDETPCR